MAIEARILILIFSVVQLNRVYASMRSIGASRPALRGFLLSAAAPGANLKELEAGEDFTAAQRERFVAIVGQYCDDMPYDGRHQIIQHDNRTSRALI